MNSPLTAGIIAFLKNKRVVEKIAKGIAASFLGVLMMACSGCGGGGDERPATMPPPQQTPTTMPIDLSQFHTCAAVSCQTETVAALNLNTPVWSSPIVKDEPVMPDAAPSQLWRAPIEILAVRNRQTGETYSPGDDYTTDAEGRLVIPAGSHIPLVPADFVNTVAPGTPAIFQPVTKDGKPLRIASDYQLHQIAVTYQAGVTLPDPIQLGSIPVSAAKIAGNQPIAVTFYWDSITAGSDSSKTIGLAPNQPGWVDLLASTMGDQYRWRNPSVPGWGSGQLAENIDTKVNTTASDLVVLAQGMNDAVAAISADTFESNIRAEIARIRMKAPATEILLVSSWLANVQWKPVDMALLEGYRSALIRISSDTAGVAMADMTAMSTAVLRAKEYEDVTSNGVNHPNDWMYMVYAQVVREAIR